LDIRQRIIQSVDDGLGTSSDIAIWVLVLENVLHMMMNAFDKVSTIFINSCFKN
jgi:hypothetical protein